MTPQTLALIVVMATLGALVVLLMVYGRPRRAAQEPLPTNFSRGDPDSVLEGPRLYRVQVWGVASAVFITAFLTVYFVWEPFREAAYGEKFLSESIERGKTEFSNPLGANCASCHGPGGEGGFAATDPSWPAPPLNNVLARYSRDEVTLIIGQGRVGTPMPSWAIPFGGTLNDQKIEDVVNFLTSIQVPIEEKFEIGELTSGAEVFAQKCAVCHGDNATGQAMGKPLPTFFAPDLTTEFYRLGIKVVRDQVTLEIENRLKGERADRTTPTEAEINAAMSAVSTERIMDAGEEAALNTIRSGRRNTPMPGWKDRLRPENIDAVLAYLRSIQRAGT